MERYDIVFKIANFDQYGEEHRLTVHPHAIKRGDGLRLAVRDLVKFAARLLSCKEEHLAAKRILVKSAWVRYEDKKKERVTGKQLLEAMLKNDIAQKGREQERIQHTPKHYKPPRRK